MKCVPMTCAPWRLVSDWWVLASSEGVDLAPVLSVISSELLSDPFGSSLPLNISPFGFYSLCF